MGKCTGLTEKKQKKKTTLRVVAIPVTSGIGGEKSTAEGEVLLIGSVQK